MTYADVVEHRPAVPILDPFSSEVTSCTAALTANVCNLRIVGDVTRHRPMSPSGKVQNDDRGSRGFWGRSEVKEDRLMQKNGS